MCTAVLNPNVRVLSCAGAACCDIGWLAYEVLCVCIDSGGVYRMLRSSKSEFSQKGQSHRFLVAFANLRKSTISFVMTVRLSVRPSARNNSAPTGRIFVKLDI